MTALTALAQRQGKYGKTLRMEVGRKIVVSSRGGGKSKHFCKISVFTKAAAGDWGGERHF
jgi:hypothetical protein